jgi:hypothetical protein
MRPRCSRLLVLWLCLVAPLAVAVDPEPYLSAGRSADPTAITLSDLRAAEKRLIPLDIQLKASSRYSSGRPVGITVILTNLFEAPLVMNGRMLVNHPLLQGEVSFRIIGPGGAKIEIRRLITPLSLRDDDFVVLNRGQSIQRSVDLADLFGVSQKGVYQVQVSYHNEIDHLLGPRRAWKGIVWSEPVEIRLD